MSLWIAVALAGAAGAPTRYLVDRAVQRRTESVLPLGTLTVNVAGSLVLGGVTGLAEYHGLGPLPKALVGTGFCGALTTFSTFGYETVRLLEEGAWRSAALNVALNTVVCLAVAGAALATVASI